MNARDIWAVVPIKDTAQAKQRLEDAVPAELKPRLALAMAEDVLFALAAARGLTGIAVVTLDAAASELARRSIPGDVPLVTPDEIGELIAAHDRTPDFVITPAHDGRGSNAVLCAPPELVPLQFGDDSFVPHLAAARRVGIEPKVIRLAGLGLDIDNPRDLAAFLQVPSRTRTRALLQAAGFHMP